MRRLPRAILILSTVASVTGARDAQAQEPSDRGAPIVVDVPWSGTVVEAEPAKAEVAPPVVIASAPSITPAPKVPATDDGFARPPGEAERLAERPLAEGIIHTPGRGITFASRDERFALTLNLAAQFLYTASDTTPDGEARATQTFEIRRARAIFSGNVFTKHVKYYLQLQFSPRDLGLVAGQVKQSPVFMAWTAFDRFRDFTPQVGLFFINYSRQRVQPILKLQFVDFALAGTEFGLERDIGVDVGSKDLGGLGKLRYHLGVFMGEGTDFARPVDFGMTYVGRVELQPLGDFDDYFDVDFARHKRPRLSVGFGYAYAHKDARTKAINGDAFADGGTVDSSNATADVMLKFAGVTVLADGFYRQGRRRFGDTPVTDPDGPPHARNGVGFGIQGGVLLPRLPIEIAGRYSAVRPIGASALNRRDEAGPALSYYFAGHSVKLQLDHAHGWGTGRTSERVRLMLTVGF